MRVLNTPNICHRNLGSLFSSTPELLRKRTTQASDGARLAVAGAQNGPELDLERMKARHLLHLQALGHRLSAKLRLLVKLSQQLLFCWQN